MSDPRPTPPRILAARAAIAAAGGPTVEPSALDTIRELRAELAGLRGERDDYAAELDQVSRELATVRAELRAERAQLETTRAALRAMRDDELARSRAKVPSDETDNRPAVNPATDDQD